MCGRDFSIEDKALPSVIINTNFLPSQYDRREGMPEKMNKSRSVARIEVYDTVSVYVLNCVGMEKVSNYREITFNFVLLR